ncbi:unnamed protein product [Closterium sp. NIES-53]
MISARTHNPSLPLLPYAPHTARDAAPARVGCEALRPHIPLIPPLAAYLCEGKNERVREAARPRSLPLRKPIHPLSRLFLIFSSRLAPLPPPPPLHRLFAPSVDHVDLSCPPLAAPAVSHSPTALQNPPLHATPTSPVPPPFSPSLSSLSSRSSLPPASYNGIPDPLGALAPSPSLYAMPPGHSIDATWLAYLADFRCLRSLRLDNCRHVTDSALSMLSALHALEHLSLTNCPLLTASSLTAILPPCLPALRSCCLSGTAVGMGEGGGGGGGGSEEWGVAVKGRRRSKGSRTSGGDSMAAPAAFNTPSPSSNSPPSASSAAESSACVPAAVPSVISLLALAPHLTHLELGGMHHALDDDAFMKLTVGMDASCVNLHSPCSHCASCLKHAPTVPHSSSMLPHLTAGRHAPCFGRYYISKTHDGWECASC